MILRSYRWLILVLFVYGTRGQDTEEEDEGTAHFNDPKGRLSWVIDDTSLPWVGSYNFLGSSISHSTVLLSVVDSSTGIKLGECITKSFPHLETFTAIPPLMQNDIWHKVVFSLQADSLQCNVSESEFHMKPFPHTHHPRSFSVRILAEKGPSCIRGLIVQNEQPIGCPPLLKRNNFSSHNFECGCRNSITNKWNNAQVNLGNVEAKSAEVKPTSPVEFPIFHLTTDEVEEEHVTDRPVFPTTAPIQASSLVSTLKIHTLPPATITPPTFIVTSHPCSSYSCLNNGTCIVDVHTQPHCICRDGYTGEHCETDQCSTVACQNGGRCQIVNGQPICQCPAGTTGTKCEQAVCEKPCQNGGQCIFMGGKHICQCLNGFIGGNCNVRDVCQNASICSVFGSEARCQLESESYASSPNETIDADYDCHCLDDKHEWAKCLDLALARQAARLTTLPTTTTTIATTSTTSTPTSTSRPAILLVPSSTLSPANEVFSKEVIKNELEREIEKGEQRGMFVASSSRKHPSNKTISIENRPDLEDYSTEKGSPEFPLTNIPTESEELSTPEFSATVSTPTTETPTFSRLPDLSPIFTKTTEESTITTSDYQEEEENNGFETFTQIVPEVEEHRTSKFGVPIYSTFKPNTPSPWPTSSKSIEIGAGGQLIHSKELNGNEIVDITESTPMEKIPEEVIIEASTNPNFVVNRGSVGLGENVKTNQQPARNRENTGATTLTWIIAISAFVALLLLTSGSGLFVLRYVKRSRRLHGKYNPAREENMVASTYAMPMTSVSKEERLI